VALFKGLQLEMQLISRETTNETEQQHTKITMIL